jgi:ubiquinone/menaquinone biosynthesis C-methylase UbiE
MGLWNQLLLNRKTILELGCGTGRIISSIPFQGRNIMGLDNSSKMLKAAEKKLSVLNQEIELYHRNFTRFNLKTCFDAILMANNTFSHLIKKRDVIRFLGCLKKHMDENSIFILEIYPKTILENKSIDNKKHYFRSYIDRLKNLKIDLYQKSQFNYYHQILTSELYFYNSNKLQHKKRFVVKFYRQKELIQIFKSEGFSITKEYGSYSKDLFTPSSKTHILLIKKTNQDCETL